MEWSLLTLANWVTSLRIVLAPLIFWSFLRSYPWYVIVTLLAIAGLSDVADGMIARRRNEISELGKVLDPVGDKLVIGAVLLAFVLKHGLPPFLAWTFLVKEGLQLLGGALFAGRNRKVIPSNVWGKASSTLYFAGFLVYWLSPGAGVYVIIAALAISVIALATYMSAAINDTTAR